MSKNKNEEVYKIGINCLIPIYLTPPKNPYEIQIKKNGEWHKINVELTFTLPAFSLKSKESKEIELNWENGYGKLSSGTYRIIKSIDYEKEEGNFETFNIAVEFNIE